MSSRDLVGSWVTITTHLLKVAVGTLNTTLITWDGVGILGATNSMFKTVVGRCALMRRKYEFDEDGPHGYNAAESHRAGVAERRTVATLTF